MTGRLRSLLCAVAALTAVAAAGSGVRQASAQPGDGHYRQGEFDLVRNILPPGQTGFLNTEQAAAHALGQPYPPHHTDQLPLYDELVRKAPQISAQDLQIDYKDASFGVPDGQIESTESPRAGLTILRDRQFGVPHVYGATDADVAFGTGWIMAEDRLFFTDVLRHYGRSTLASFIGPSKAAIEMDCAQAQLTGYSEAELDQQVATLPAPFPQLAQDYVDGINAYITQQLVDPSKRPAEYDAIGLVPQPWNVGDVIAIAGLVGGIFGKGGGVEARNAHFLRALYTAYGGPGNVAATDPARANAIFNDLMESNDSAAPTTEDVPFSYESHPTVDPKAVALTRDAPRDPTKSTCSVAPSVSSASRLRVGTRGAATFNVTPALDALRRPPHEMSNALLVDAAHSTTGRPIAVFGPQVSYFSPEVLMEEDLHGPSFDVRGASFPGTNFIVELGHGPDYAWSATSAGTDNIDQRAERLCNPQNTEDPLAGVDPNSTFYMFNGRCTPMEERSQTEVALPTAQNITGDPTELAPKIVTMKIERTVHGPVLDRTTALVDGAEVPVAISTQRSTFMHEADSISGFAAFNNPDRIHNATDFLHAAAQIQYTFNWFYIDNRDIAYYQSGLLPIRAAGVSPVLPSWGTGEWEWRGWLGESAHVHVINPAKGWMTSWNNKGGPGFRASDDQWSYGPVFRSQSLDSEIRGYLSRQGGRMSLTDLDNAMMSAGTVDLRGTQLLPDALRIVAGDESVKGPAAVLKSWLDNGAHRRDRDNNGIYDEVEAVELMDAWYPRLLHAIFNGVVNAPCGTQVERPTPPEMCDDSPSGSHGVGSSYIEGWYGYAQKVMDMVLGKAVAQPYSEPYCGTPAECRRALVASLQAAAADAAQADPRATTRNDDIVFAAVGLQSVPNIPWQNRPTFQQIVDIPGHRGSAPVTVAPATSGPVVSLPNTAAARAGAGAGLLALAGMATTALLGRRRRRR